jgi:hypothetical protein
MTFLHACLASLVVLCASGVSVGVEPEASDDPRAAIIKTLQVHFQACNEENMAKLLATMSKDLPNQRLLVSDVESQWGVNDTYTKLEDVEILDDSDAPHAVFEYPYETALVTQTVIELSVGNERNEVFYRKCRKPDADAVSLAKDMGLATCVATTQVEVLFRHEDGEWRFVRGLTAPKLHRPSAENDTLGVGVPSQVRMRESNTVFK